MRRRWAIDQSVAQRLTISRNAGGATVTSRPLIPRANDLDCRRTRGDGQRFVVRADEKGLIDPWARDLCDALRNYRVNDHANPEYRRENNSNSSCRESYDDDHCQPSETCSPMALVPKSNRAEEES